VGHPLKSPLLRDVVAKCSAWDAFRRKVVKRSEKEKGDLFEHLVRAAEVVQLPLQRVHKNVLGSSFDPDGGEFSCLTRFPDTAT
jgi:hypothetical protein